MDTGAIALKTLEPLIDIRFSRRLQTGIAILRGTKGFKGVRSPNPQTLATYTFEAWPRIGDRGAILEKNRCDRHNPQTHDTYTFEA
jgi:hypothetical protein